MILDLFKKFLKKELKYEEIVTELTPENIRRFIPTAIETELSELRRQIMLLQEQLKEKDRLLEEYKKFVEKKEEEEIKRAKKIAHTIESKTRKRIYFNFERPIKAFSADGLTFFDSDGVEYPYFTGIELQSTPYGVFVRPLLRSADGKQVKALNVNPPIPIENFSDLFKEKRLLVGFLHDGYVILNVLSDGTFVGGEYNFSIIEEIETIQPKKVEKEVEKNETRSE